KTSKRRSAGPARVLIVDDHPVVRRGLAQVLGGTDDLAFCGEAETAADALQAVAETGPDVAVVDLTLKGKGGLELVKDLHARHPDLPVLVLSMHDESLYAERALRAGARGYIMKDGWMEEVVRALRQVLAGRVYLSERMTSRLLGRLTGGGAADGQSPISTLTDRELEVFEMIGQGLATREIADRLHLSVKTVDTHRENIKRKLNLSSATELYRHAFLWAQQKSAGGSEA
ncbi:MAG: response regulator transcription factor, partial [Planctomycetota bacterium]|nr:response regulator transcription factor [Planctomycetota bacterium]